MFFCIFISICFGEYFSCLSKDFVIIFIFLLFFVIRVRYVFFCRVCLVIFKLMLFEVFVRNKCFFCRLDMNGFFGYSSEMYNVVKMVIIIYEN